MTTKEAEARSKNAEQAARWRERHPDRYAATKKRQLARRRALRKLGELHPAELERLYAQELLNDG